MLDLFVVLFSRFPANPKTPDLLSLSANLDIAENVK